MVDKDKEILYNELEAEQTELFDKIINTIYINEIKPFLKKHNYRIVSGMGGVNFYDKDERNVEDRRQYDFYIDSDEDEFDNANDEVMDFRNTLDDLAEKFGLMENGYNNGTWWIISSIELSDEEVYK